MLPHFSPYRLFSLVRMLSPSSLLLPISYLRKLIQGILGKWRSHGLLYDPPNFWYGLLNSSPLLLLFLCRQIGNNILSTFHAREPTSKGCQQLINFLPFIWLNLPNNSFRILFSVFSCFASFVCSTIVSYSAAGTSIWTWARWGRRLTTSAQQGARRKVVVKHSIKSNQFKSISRGQDTFLRLRAVPFCLGRILECCGLVTLALFFLSFLSASSESSLLSCGVGQKVASHHHYR